MTTKDNNEIQYRWRKPKVQLRARGLKKNDTI